MNIIARLMMGQTDLNVLERIYYSITGTRARYVSIDGPSPSGLKFSLNIFESLDHMIVNGGIWRMHDAFDDDDDVFFRHFDILQTEVVWLEDSGLVIERGTEDWNDILRVIECKLI